MYITKKAKLDVELEERKANRGLINENIDRWIEEKYGIMDFHNIVEHFFGSSNGHTCAILPRHIPTLKIEDLMSYIGSIKLGLQPMGFSFENDRFNVSNWSKHSCTKMPFLKRQGGSIQTEPRYVPCKKGSRYVGNKFEKLNNVSLNHIFTADGIPFMEYHRNMRKNVFNGSFKTVEVSNFLEHCFSVAREQGRISPNLMAYLNMDGKQIKVEVGSVSPDTVLRPPMEWYYPILFCLFVDGKWVMLETYKNAPEAEIEFNEAVELVSKASGGFKPIVAETPLNVQAENFVSKAMLEYNPQIQNKDDLNELVEVTSNIESANIPEMFYQIAQEAISFKL